MNVLIVAAHPDDEVLGCGGTIPRLVEDGHQVYIAILGEGITSRYDRREDADRAAVEELQNRCREAARVLGAEDVYTRELPDNRFDTVPLLDVVKIVEQLVEQVSPATIYTHHGGDLNVDHAVVHRAVLTATRPVAGEGVREIYAFEVASSTEWAFQQFGRPFEPNVFVDISATLQTKIDALSLYEGELRNFPHPRSPDAIRANAQRWGSVVGRDAAEAFQLVRAVR